MKAVFADTFYWIALANPRDEAHRRVLDFGKRRGPSPIITTDEVLTEFLAFCASDAQLRVEAAAVVQDVLSASQGSSRPADAQLLSGRVGTLPRVTG